MNITAEVRALADVLWEYHRLAPELEKSDVILVLGSHDVRVAEHAARVWQDGWAPLIAISGGRGKVTETWADSEAAVFAGVAEGLGVPRSAMILEEEATNTGENITRTRSLLAARGIEVRRAILVAKPYMARRAVATARKQWPGVEWLVSTAEVTLAGYLEGDASELRTIELMVGDLQRIKVYAERGFQAPMEIPPAVWTAYDRLVALGFTRYVL
ncbi:YdcF family protein [Amycolatopsis sp. NPDC059657]|uniref:YdcF family protein n=1 Tax=Amycolatopsis sp. NPDC059657 TaxID=3346899 RepID=UPI00366DB54B